jgi:predicted DNA-binding protein (UPF0251 family)
MSHTQCISCNKLFTIAKSSPQNHNCGLGRKKKNLFFKKGTIHSTPLLLKPQGIPASETSFITLSSEELEILKLKNIENIHQADIATKMSLSQSTLARTLKELNKKITTALVNNWGIKIK